MSSNMSDWKQSTILGKNKPMLGESAVRQLAVWVRMSRVKHDWQREVHGDEHIVVDALQSELDELRHAIERHDPTEHVISEILDLICVAWRFLIGEHVENIDTKFRAWVKELENIKPTQPGEVSPYDEHKEGSEYERNGSRSYSERREEEMGHDYGMRCERCGRHLCLDESANGGLCHACLEKAALEDEEKRPVEDVKVMSQDEANAMLRGEISYCDRCGKEYVRTSDGCLCPDCDAVLEEACKRDCNSNEVEKEWRKQGKLPSQVNKAKPEISTEEAVAKLYGNIKGEQDVVVATGEPDVDSNGHCSFPNANIVVAQRGKTLFDAIKIINGERQEKHGKPEDSFGIIASLWNGYLDGLAKSQDTDPEYYPLTFPTLKPQHAAQMMALMKVARTLNNAAVHDSHVDALGYLALAADMEKVEA